jgi:hypothetical protein
VCVCVCVAPVFAQSSFAPIASPVVTVVLQWCYSSVIVVSQRRHSAATVLSQWCYSGVTVDSPSRPCV